MIILVMSAENAILAESKSGDDKESDKKVPAKDKRQFRESFRAKCPYYVKHTPQRIRCAQLSDGVCPNLTFDNRTRYRDFYVKYCCTRQFVNCPIAQLIDSLAKR